MKLRGEPEERFAGGRGSSVEPECRSLTQIRVKDGVRVEVESLLSVRRPLIMFSVFRKRLDQYDEIAPLIGQPGARAHGRMCASKPMRKHTRARTHTQAHTYTYAHITHTHTHTHTHTQHHTCTGHERMERG